MTKSEAGKLGYQASLERRLAKKEHMKQLGIRKYEANPKKCQECATIIPYEFRINSFCNKTCSATYNNRKRGSPMVECHNPLCSNMLPAFKKRPYCSRNCYINDEKRRRREKVLSGCASHDEVKKYMLEIYGNKCMDPECLWDMKKRPIKVEMDHINGISFDHRIENLRLLCPNCHSLTNTFRSRNGNRYKKMI